MEELIIYLLKSGLITAVFFGIYWIMLKNETFYRFNRHFLLAGIIASLLLPFIKYSYNINVVVQSNVNPARAVNYVSQSTNGLPLWLSITLFFYAAGASFLMIRHIAGLLKIKKLVLKYGYTLFQGYKVINTPIFKSSFSVFNYIFIDISAETSDKERKLILAHELAHVKQQHWVDLLAVQVICALQWFNPFAWLYLHVIKQNHEFLADEAVLKQGNSPAVYRAALINHSLKTQVFSFASSFASNDKFKRIKMMTKANSNPYRKIAVLIVIPAFALFLYAFSEPKYTMIQLAKLQPAHHPIELPKLPKREKVIQLTAVSIKGRAGHLILKSKPKGTIVTADSLTTTMTVSTHNNRLIVINNSKTSTKTEEPLIMYDGKVVATISNINSADIQSVNVIKGSGAVEKYGEKAKNGVIEVHSKKQAPTAEPNTKIQ